MFLRRKIHGPNKNPLHSKGPKECDQSNAIFEGIALGQQQENSEKERAGDIWNNWFLYNIFFKHI